MIIIKYESQDQSGPALLFCIRKTGYEKSHDILILKQEYGRHRTPRRSSLHLQQRFKKGAIICQNGYSRRRMTKAAGGIAMNAVRYLTPSPGLRQKVMSGPVRIAAQKMM